MRPTDRYPTRRKAPAGSLCLLTTLLLGAFLSCSPAPPEGPLRGDCLVVEDVAPDSTPARAGLEAGDRICGWEAAGAAEVAGSSVAAEAPLTPFDWYWLRVELAPRGDVTLLTRRDGAASEIEVPAGRWPVEVRPELTPAARTLYSAGRELVAAGDVEHGVERWQQLARAARRQGDPAAACWLELESGNAWRTAERWPEADLDLEEALAEADSPIAEVAVLDSMARSSELRQELSTAAELRHRALGVLRSERGEGLAVARQLALLGNLRWSTRELEGAAELYEQAFAIRSRLAPASLELADSHHTLGLIAHGRGDLDGAERHYEDALRIRRRLQPASRSVAATWLLLGNVAFERGDLDLAERHYRRDLRLLEELGDGGAALAQGLQSLGRVAFLRNDPVVAEELFGRALGIFAEQEPESPAVADSLLNLGNVYALQERFATANEHYDEALELRRKQAPGSSRVAEVLVNRGFVAQELGDLNRAWADLLEALTIYEEVSPDAPVVARTLSKLGAVERQRGNEAAASKRLERALDLILRTSPNSISEARIRRELATLRRLQGDEEASLALHLEALTALERQVGRLGGSQDIRSGFRSQYGAFYRDAIALLCDLEREPEAFALLERYRARGFLALLAERGSRPGAGEAVARQELERIRTPLEVNQRQRATALARGDTALAAELQRQRILAWRDLEAKEQEIRRARGEASSPHAPFGLEAAAAALDPETVLLSYSVGKDETTVFCVRPTGHLQTERLPLGEELLTAATHRLRRLITERDPSAAQARRQDAAYLFEQLVEPVVRCADGGQRLLIQPDGPLNLLPWGALVRRQGRSVQYLVEWKPFHLALSMTTYSALKARSRSRSQAPEIDFVGFGDPAYPEGSEHWPRLPDTSREVRAAAAHFPASSAIFLESEAVEETARELAPQARYLHLAAHGFVDDASPMDSAIVLATPGDSPDEREDGWLQAWEILTGTPLTAELVVLSACQTAVGKDLAGDGLAGLTRSVQIAGADSVLASLWNVSDDSTAVLMNRFYDSVARGTSKDRSLRSAQIDLIHGRNGVPPRDIVHWAGFQLYGDWK